MSKFDKFVGFYTNPPFWYDTKPNIKSIIQNENLFHNSLSKIEHTFKDKSFTINVCKDGLVMIKIHLLDEQRETTYKNDQLLYNSNYLDYVNAFQLLLLSSQLEIGKLHFLENINLNSHNVIRISLSDVRIEGAGLPDKNISHHVFDGRHLRLYSPFVAIESDIRIAGRQCISEETIKRSVLNFSRVVSNSEIIFILSQMNGSLSAYHELNFRQSLILSWFTIEYLLNKLWINFLVSKKLEHSSHNRIKKDRQDNLTNRDFTSSVISNILELNNIIPFHIFELINEVRRVRNDIVHNLDRVKLLKASMKENRAETKLKSIDYSPCFAAFKVLEYFIDKEFNLKIHYNSSISFAHL